MKLIYVQLWEMSPIVDMTMTAHSERNRSSTNGKFKHFEVLRRHRHLDAGEVSRTGCC
ncbi:hypothetical protein [Danxiaibacter flavus]|uniref:hypothetical protein n=1 Tax=Danxiaibacter flavus TaxID=3049108 RepID=UPI0034E0CDF5